MSTNYDPDGKPTVSPAMEQMAVANRLHIVNVICDEKDSKVGDHTGLSVAALVPYLPRIGERIVLEDDKVCRVRDVIHKFATVGGCPFCIPNVYAVREENLSG